MNTFLFDLDGTLLPLDLKEFTQAYFKELTKKLAGKINPKELQKLILKSTNYMVSNLEENKTNKEAFFEDFQKNINIDINSIKVQFEEFYKNEFKNLKEIVCPNPIVKKIIKLLKSKGYTLVIATNPIFPKEAIYHRIEWAGLNINDFDLITTFEKMHFCKPNIEYYQEILNILNKEPEDVMMIGNDLLEDMIASKLGIKTYLIEDYMIDRSDKNIEPDYRGSLEEFYKFVKDLQNL
ncbi:HAD family hydrolase [Thermohalobacter berrensis]|uniref:HAD family hydrolase n=1 Tax=Thermohalobacter berrensis TaxID=99594 RepID=UPI00242D5EF4|nr:HAD family hydrolase [Thermohalobacter berrensis]